MCASSSHRNWPFSAGANVTTVSAMSRSQAQPVPKTAADDRATVLGLWGLPRWRSRARALIEACYIAR